MSIERHDAEHARSSRPSPSRRRRHPGQVSHCRLWHWAWYDAVQRSSTWRPASALAAVLGACVQHASLLPCLCLGLDAGRSHLASVTASWTNNAEQQRSFKPSTWQKQVLSGTKSVRWLKRECHSSKYRRQAATSCHPPLVGSMLKTLIS